VPKIDDSTSTYNIVFLDGDRERERRVLPKHLRRCAEDDRAARTAAFERLRAMWQEPIACRDEVLRLHEVRDLDRVMIVLLLHFVNLYALDLGMGICSFTS
jgi:hypothetical protein